MTQVARTENIGPHMRRIILQGDELSDFPAGHASAHCKAIFPSPGQSQPKLGVYAGFKKWMRTYTVRDFNDQTKELTVDFAVNDHEGLATNWAKNAQVGDYLGIAGPGEIKYPNYHADWHLLVVDLTGLPAAAAILENLPENATGSAFIQVPTAEDKQTILAPKGIDLHWVINDNLSKNALLEQVENLVWQDGNPSIFVAAESSQMRAINEYLKTNSGYDQQQTYTSGYWSRLIRNI